MQTLRRYKIWIAATLSAVFLVGIVYSATLSDSYRYCQTDRSSQYAQRNKPDFFEKAGSFVVCEGITLDVNGELVTAVGTVFIALFTLTLWIVTEGALTLARDEFISTHRPKIRIRWLKVLPLQIGQPVRMEFIIINVGDSDALNIAGRLDFKILMTDGKQQTFPTPFSTGGDLAAGETMVASVPAQVTVAEEWEIIGRPGGRISIHGRVNYTDRRGIVRQTGFYRRLDGNDLNRFSRFKDEDIRSDYEYED